MLRRVEKPPPGTTTRGRSLLLVTSALGLATLLNAQPLLDTAQSLPFGWKRDVAVAVMERIADVSAALRLDVPRRELDRALGHEVAPKPEPQPTPTPAPTAGPSPGPTPTATPTVAPSPTPTAARVPTSSDPLRIRVVGDSMAQAPGQSLIRLAAANGRARAVLDFRFSSGLTRPDFFDWPAHLAEALSIRKPPEAFVVFFGANDAQGMETSHGVLRFGTTAWDTDYARRVAAVMDQLTAGGAHVFWVGQPIARSSSYAQRMKRLDGIYEREAAKHAGVRYVDSWSLFTTPDGDYSAYLRTDDGLTLMRLADGIHLTRAGGDRLARVILADIGREWRLTS
jgi:hypothetical protein